MIIAIDFDDTLCEFDFPRIGQPKFDVIEKAKEAKEKGHKLILWTCRSSNSLSEAILWCRLYELEFDVYNDDLPEIKELWNNDVSNKITADLYVDDKSPGSIEYFLNMEL